MALQVADAAALRGRVSGNAPTDAPTFIETQFPVSRLSKESYKERKANYSQTLTGLGKWWGRKPLVLVRELGERRFGRIPRVGDAFCGGGSVPFEAARIGCEAYGSDLNPVAALLTWGALNIVGGGKAVAQQVREAQTAVFEAVDRQVTEWGIEHDEDGWRADAFLYCTETICPECGWRIPLAPSWVIGEKTHTLAKLTPEQGKKRFAIGIHSGQSREALTTARNAGTVRNSRLECPNCQASTPMAAIRGDQRGGGGRGYGLRQWRNDDLAPRPEDVFQERLYCVRWRSPGEEAPAEYRSVGDADLQREARALALLQERFAGWQAKGCIPSRAITPGDETTRLLRERGWTHWHHLFRPRQLLVHGALAEASAASNLPTEAKAACLLGLGRVADWNSKLSRWHPHSANEKSEQVFSNQALNTLDSYAGRYLASLVSAWTLRLQAGVNEASGVVFAADSRVVGNQVDICVTDPPYADAVNYHELSEFFLAWYDKPLSQLFPSWYTDSKRALAVRGTGTDFRRSMVDSYRNLANNMPDNGMQLVMFTHQDASVWADLTLILWAAGLRVTAAWTIATETDSALKEGNYVQGTVLMVLRKQAGDEQAFLDEIVPEVEVEVERQLQSMLELDDRDDPNFSDADYQLAAYAAALRVLTQYGAIEDVDIAYQLSRERRRGEPNPIEKIIADAVRTASNFLIPDGLPDHVWRSLAPEEKLYLKGLDIERHGDFRSGVYQEFARGFGVQDYRHLLHTGKANQTRLKTASEFKRSNLHGASLVRHALYAVWRAAETGDTAESLTWLRTELPNYWPHREALAAVLRYLTALEMDHWQQDAAAARLVAGTVENDHV